MRKERKADDEDAIKRREFKRQRNEKKNEKKRKNPTADDSDMKKTSEKKPRLEKESSAGTGEPEAIQKPAPEDISFALEAGLETGGKKSRVHIRKRDRLTHALEKAEKQQGDKSFEMEKMIKRAQGEKVLDDTKLLKKSLKSMEQKKLRSKKKWDQRIKQQKKNTADAQKKRQANIDARKAAKASKSKAKQKNRKMRR
mmetsp:Transcript_26276/g.102714  ORF Transcript_26276/g.102714 Transcript_26276/m.102714 type:complete len:198 (+) Transcript_26276:561-1154(+)